VLTKLQSTVDHRVYLCLLFAHCFAGHVYKGTWAGRDVAVKIIAHDTTNTDAVENEVRRALASSMLDSLAKEQQNYSPASNLHLASNHLQPSRCL
jgi:predicted Ser/Thr protein kinase